MAVCPWPDFFGNVIEDGDMIYHPNGEGGRVVYCQDEDGPHDQWRVDYGDGVLSRLCLQITDKGQAAKATNPVSE